jgi:regulator of protease activity HflC (stomatin/prohibitin superfamily)
MDVLVWILVLAVIVYGGAAVVASFKFVPDGNIGIVRGPGGSRKVVGRGLHMLAPVGYKVKLIPVGPERMDGDVRDVITRDGWRIMAHVQLNARLLDEVVAAEGGDDWRKATIDAALQVLRTELENNDAIDLRPRPQALDEGVRDELNVLASKWGVDVDWLRITIRWAYSVPPAHEVHRPF